MMGKHATFIAYIDESGDEGFLFDKGSSAWFVLSAAIFRRQNELEQVKLVDEVRKQINRRRKPDQQIPPKKPLHFRDLKHEQRKFYAAQIAEADLKTVSILLQKSAITSPEIFIQDSRLYFYAARLLIERISWFCRDHYKKNDQGDGSVVLVFSNRASMDYEALRHYLEHLDVNHVALNYRAAPDIVHAEAIETYTPGRRMGLQIADAVASSYFYAVERSSYGMTEESYARLLLRVAYRHQTQLWGYGVKIMPKEAEEERRKGTLFPGLK